MIEVDVGLNLVTENTRKELVFDFSRLSVLSQVHNQNIDGENHVPHFPSLSRQMSSGNPTMRYGGEDGIASVEIDTLSEDFPSSSHSVAHISSVRVVRSRDKKFILKHFGALIRVEKAYCGPGELDYALVGHGSISGLDMNISLSEIQVSKEVCSNLFVLYQWHLSSCLIFRRKKISIYLSSRLYVILT